MNYLIDAQLPRRISYLLREMGFDVIHTLDLIQKNESTDMQLLQIAENENRIIITKDADFLESHILFKQPEKLLLVKTGNISNNELVNILNNFMLVADVLFNTNNLIELHRDQLIIHE